jgi:hypothetical protein
MILPKRPPGARTIRRGSFHADRATSSATKSSGWSPRVNRAAMAPGSIGKANAIMGLYEGRKVR